MKVKLLKKIRKRYGWYMTEDKGYVLIDLASKELTIINLKYVQKHCNYSDEDLKIKLDIDQDEWVWRWLKTKMLQPFGFTWLDIAFNLCRRRSERKYKLLTK